MADLLPNGNARYLQAHEAEVSVLGSVLLHPASFDQIADILEWGDFLDTRHKQIFEVMTLLAHKGEDIDPITIAAHLDQKAALKNAGGIEYLMELADASASSRAIVHHAKIVRDRSDVRRLQTAMAEVNAKANDGDYEAAGELIDEAAGQIMALSLRRESGAVVPMRKVLTAAITSIQAANANPGAVIGLTTGFDSVDRWTQGFVGGELVILAARPAMGKSALALNIATNAARAGEVSVAYFSLEMPHQQLGLRMVSSEARVEAEKCRTGYLSDGDIDRLLMATRRLEPLRIDIDDSGGLTLAQVRATCRRIAADKGRPPLGLVVIDYLQLMKGKQSRGGNREQEISGLSRGLKRIAGDLNVPILCLSQLNRGVDQRQNKRPMLSDLRESGAIEQDADQILFVYRDEYYNEDTEDRGIAEVILGKNRRGATGTAKLHFAKQYTRFDDIQKSEWR